VYESSHMVPRNELIKEVLNWGKYWARRGARQKPLNHGAVERPESAARDALGVVGPSPTAGSARAPGHIPGSSADGP
jgi:hypothetical protein